jgi:hypothetical protein
LTQQKRDAEMNRDEAKRETEHINKTKESCIEKAIKLEQEVIINLEFNNCMYNS